jgi:hypothetical protein
VCPSLYRTVPLRFPIKTSAALSIQSQHENDCVRKRTTTPHQRLHAIATDRFKLPRHADEPTSQHQHPPKHTQSQLIASRGMLLGYYMSCDSFKSVDTLEKIASFHIYCCSFNEALRGCACTGSHSRPQLRLFAALLGAARCRHGHPHARSPPRSSSHQTHGYDRFHDLSNSNKVNLVKICKCIIDQLKLHIDVFKPVLGRASRSTPTYSSSGSSTSCSSQSEVVWPPSPSHRTARSSH